MEGLLSTGPTPSSLETLTKHWGENGERDFESQADQFRSLRSLLIILLSKSEQ